MGASIRNKKNPKDLDKVLKVKIRIKRGTMTGKHSKIILNRANCV
jgi:hypothetical protein